MSSTETVVNDKAVQIHLFVKILQFSVASYIYIYINPTPETGVYSIRCATRNKPYIGGRSKPLKKRVYEHKQTFLKNDTSYALVQHRKKRKG